MNLIRRLATSAFAAVATRAVVRPATHRDARLVFTATEASAALVLGPDSAAPEPDSRAEF